jgi:hypothetical protein
MISSKRGIEREYKTAVYTNDISNRSSESGIEQKNVYIEYRKRKRKVRSIV